MRFWKPSALITCGALLFFVDPQSIRRIGPTVSSPIKTMTQARNSITTDLVAYWGLNELSGNRLNLGGSCGSACDLTPVNAPGVGGGAGSYALLTNQASNQLVTTRTTAINQPNASFTIAVWATAASLANTYRMLAGSQSGAATDWQLFVASANGKPSFQVFDSVSGNAFVNHSTTVAAGTRYLFVGVLPQSTRIPRLYVNAVGESAAGSLTTGVSNTHPNVAIGDRGGSSSGFSWEGAIGPAYFWQGTPLVDADVTALYNSGKGYTCENLPASLRTGLTACWNLDEASGTRAVSSVSGCALNQVLTKTGGGAAYNAGASSTQTITRGSYIDIIPYASLSGYSVFGLSGSDTDQAQTGMSHGWYIEPSAGPNIHAYEGGIRASTTYTFGDVFRINIATDGTVTYLKNGAIIYTSLVNLAGTRVIDSSLYNVYQYPIEVLINGTTYPTWTNKVNVSSASACDLTVVNAPGRTAGLVENGMGMSSTFNGSTQLLSVADNASLRSGSKSFSLVAWANQTDTTSRYVFGKIKSATNEREWYVATSAGGNRLTAEASASGAAPYAVSLTTGIILAQNTWHLAYFEYNAATQKLGLSADAGALAVSAGTTASIFGGTATFDVASINGAGSGAAWLGSIDAVAYWNRVLTANERTALYNAGAGVSWPLTPLVGNLLDSPKMWHELPIEQRQRAVWAKTGVYLPPYMFPSRKVVIR